jgi:DNA polymerase III epsilon subunit-like protein
MQHIQVKSKHFKYYLKECYIFPYACSFSFLKKFGHHDFGDYTIDTLHLSQRHGVGKDGYYGCAGSISLL